MSVQVIKNYLEKELEHIAVMQQHAPSVERYAYWDAQKKFINQMFRELAGEFTEERPEDEGEFQRDLAFAINRNSKEGGSDTPDFVLAQYLEHALKAFDYAVRYRASTKDNV